MKILAIDTSGNACSVALLCQDRITSFHEVAPMQHAKLILPLIQQLLRDKNITLNQIDAIAFGCGPGSFTGVRIATSVIQGLGFALDLPIISISSLAALAQTAYQERGWENILVCVDARIQEVYYAAYEVREGIVHLVGKEWVCKPELIVIPDQKAWYGVGNGWETYPIPYQPIEIDTSCTPTASAIIKLAQINYSSHDFLSPAAALPVYLRNSVAKKANA